MMNKKNDLVKKVLKKGRTGWVVATSVVAGVAVLGTAVYQTQSSPTQILTKTGSSKTVESSSSNFKEDKDSVNVKPQVSNNWLGEDQYNFAYNATITEDTQREPQIPISYSDEFNVADIIKNDPISVKPVETTPVKPAESTHVEETVKPVETTPAKPAETTHVEETVKPVETTPVKPAETTKVEETVKPVETTPVKPAETTKVEETVKPVETAPVKPAETTKVEETVKPVETTPVKPAEFTHVEETVKPVETTPAKPAESTHVEETVKPVETTPAKPAETTHVEETVKPVETTPVKPADEIPVENDFDNFKIDKDPSNKALDYHESTIVKSETEREVLEFGTDYIPDNNLLIGNTHVEFAGENGSIEKTYLVTYKNGKEISRRLKKQVTRVPRNKKVHVGTKKNNILTKEEVSRTPITKKTDYIPDPNLNVGVQNEVNPGLDGELLEVYSVITENDKVVSKTLISSTTKEPKNRIVHVGTGANFELNRSTKTITVPFNTERISDSNLLENKEEVDVVGKNGHYDETTINYGDGHNKTIRENEVLAINQVLRVGTKKVVKEVRLKTEIEDGENYSVIERETNQLYKNEKRVLTFGKKEKITKTYKEYYEDGSLVKRELIDTQTTPALNQEVEVGTLEHYIEKVVEEVIPSNSVSEKRVPDNNLFDGETREVPGVDGVNHYRVVIENQRGGGETEVNKVLLSTTPAKEKIVYFGTKPIKSETSVEEKEDILPEIKEENDPELPDGEIRTVNGENGYNLYRKVFEKNNKTGELKEIRRELISTIPSKPTINYHGTQKADPTDVILSKNSTTDYLKESLSKLKSLGNNGADFNNLNHRSVKYLHDHLSQADKDSISLDITDDSNNTSKPVDNLLRTAFDASKLSQTDLNKIENIIDNRKMNEYFVELLNKERQRKGLSPASIASDDSKLTEVADLRANEMADYGSIRYGGKKEGKHRRPDGTKWITAYDKEYLGTLNGITENAAEVAGTWDVISLTNEKALAHYFYTLWKNSPGHYRALMLGLDPKEKQLDKNVEVRMSVKFANHHMTSSQPINVVGMMEIASIRK